MYGQGVREEAITLKDNMQGMLIKEEIEITNCSKERHAVLEEYRFEPTNRLDFLSFFFFFSSKFNVKFEGILILFIHVRRINI